MRTLAIGDIHGCKKALETLIEAVGLNDTHRIVFLGDYVDRGPDSKGVIDYLIDLQSRHDVVFLKGNHEVMMLEARQSRERILPWTGVGGDKTLDSYGAKDFSAVPDSHWDFLNACLPYYETENHIFVHASASPDLEMSDQPDYMLYWEFFDNPIPHQSGKKIICGHSSQKNGQPLSVGHAICIDTFAHGGGWLTCMDVESEYCWRANQKGEVREDPLDAIANSTNVH